MPRCPPPGDSDAAPHQAGTIDYDELEAALMWVSAAPPWTQAAYIDRRSAQVYYRSDLYVSDKELPEDVDDAGTYLSVPHKYDLDLGRELMLQFAAAHLADEYDKVRFFFSKRGAYGRFKDLLDYRGQLDAWYEHERLAAERALREWAAENGLAVGAAHRRP